MGQPTEPPTPSALPQLSLTLHFHLASLATKLSRSKREGSGDATLHTHGPLTPNQTSTPPILPRALLVPTPPMPSATTTTTTTTATVAASTGISFLFPSSSLLFPLSTLFLYPFLFLLRFCRFSLTLVSMPLSTPVVPPPPLSNPHSSQQPEETPGKFSPCCYPTTSTTSAFNRRPFPDLPRSSFTSPFSWRAGLLAQSLSLYKVRQRPHPAAFSPLQLPHATVKTKTTKRKATNRFSFYKKDTD